jgi:MFS family permease
MTTSAPPTPADYPPTGPRAALALPEFRRYLLTTFALTVAVGVQAVALGWQIFSLTGSKFLLGMTGLAEALPSIGIMLFAGHFADRRDRRKMILGATAALVVCSLAFVALAAATPAPAPAAPEGPAWSARPGDEGGVEEFPRPPAPLTWRSPLVLAIYGVIVLTGFARGILQPARTALGTDIVPRHMLTAAINLRTTAWQTGMILGPPLGGLVYWLGGAVLAFAVDAALLTVAFGAVWYMERRPPPPAPEGPAEPILDSLKTGIRFVFGRKEILGALSLDLFAVFFGGATALLPAFAQNILHVDAKGLGFLRAAPAAGAVLMAFYIARRPPFRRAGPTMIGAVGVFGVAMIAFALSRSFALSLVFLALSGAADYVSVVVRHTLVQTRTPTDMLGRVSAVNSIFIGSSNEIGAFESGVAAEILGTVPSVVFGGCMTLLVVAIVWARCPALRKLGSLK